MSYQNRESASNDGTTYDVRPRAASAPARAPRRRRVRAAPARRRGAPVGAQRAGAHVQLEAVEAEWSSRHRAPSLQPPEVERSPVVGSKVHHPAVPLPLVRSGIPREQPPQPRNHRAPNQGLRHTEFPHLRGGASQSPRGVFPLEVSHTWPRGVTSSRRHVAAVPLCPGSRPNRRSPSTSSGRTVRAVGSIRTFKRLLLRWGE